MTYTFFSRKLGNEITFSVPGKSYVFIDWDGKHPGTLGQQICDGGMLRGNTITYDRERGTQAGFERICKNWFRRYLEKHPDCDI